MKNYGTISLLLGIILLTAWLEVSSALDTLWETYTESGISAYERGDYATAERQHTAAVKEAQKFSSQDTRLAISLNNLAQTYVTEARYREAEPLYKRSLTILERAVGSNHSDVAKSLNGLAMLYKTQGRYEEAEPLFRRALKIVEQVLGPNNLEMAKPLNNLAALYLAQGRYAEAGPLLQQSLMIREKALGSDHPDVAKALNNLGEIYRVGCCRFGGHPLTLIRPAFRTPSD